MRFFKHPLKSTCLGTQREITSFHYGPESAGRKVYVQASLHADELPGMLVAHHLRQQLAALEAAGRLLGQVVVVPVANPVGLAQWVLRSQQGRFDLQTGENFNRHYPALFEPVVTRVTGKLTTDPDRNVRLVRTAMIESLDAVTAQTELESLRLVLMRLACDAEVVLDLHCDFDAAVHLYAGTPMADQAEPLARLLEADATLLATESGDNPFDECCAQTWWQLADHFGTKYPIPMACLAVTVELRGQMDVNHAQAQLDAKRLIDFLVYRGIISGEPPTLPALRHAATPLAGSMPVVATTSGVVAFHRHPGDFVEAGAPLVDVIDPISGVTTTLTSPVAGVMYTRENRYFALVGTSLCRVAGAEASRTGKLLSAK